MSLEQLWAGWRMPYVSAVGDAADPGTPRAAAEPGSSCVFCGIIASQASEEDRLVVSTGKAVITLLNAYPYASGHLMVMPLRHIAALDELTDDEEIELWSTVRRSVAALERTYRPDGCNLGVNLGRAAGAGVPGHLHVHAVPRWIGDTNFMTSTASVRVLPEALGDSVSRLRAAWQ
jgi:ATP adenylyltransferase